MMNYHHIRVVRGDDQWLSPTSSDVPGTSGDVLCIAFGMNVGLEHDQVLEEISGLEAVLEPYQPRAHMGKLCTLPPAVWRERHGDKLQRFVALARSHDPTGKFSNEYTDTWVFGGSGTGGRGLAKAASEAEAVAR